MICAQVAQVTVDANGNVINVKPTDFPTGKFKSNHVTLETLLAGKEAQDPDLDAIAALSTTSFGRGFLTLADAPGARSYIAAAADSAVVHNTGTETIAGVKTFSSLPVWPNQSANLFFAGPSSGTASAPGFRSLIANDIPALQNLNGSLNWSQIAVPNVTNAIFVSQASGDDSKSGTILGGPKLTIGGAKSVASSGQTIVILDGTFDERNLLKNGVNYFFFAGSGISSTSTNSSGIFDDYTTGANAAVTCAIAGYGIFSSSDTHGVIYLRNASTINFQGKSLSASGGSTIFTRNANLHLRADTISDSFTGAGAAVWWNSGECFVEADDITGPGPATVYSTAVFGEQIGKYFWVRAKKIYNTSSTISSSYKAVWFQDGDTAARSWVEAQEIKGPIAVSTQFGSGVNYIIKTGKIFGKIDHSGTGFLYLDTQKVSDDGLGSNLLSISGSGGSSWMNIAQFDDTGLSGVTAVLVSNGTNYLTARSLNRATSGNAVSVSGGSLTLSGAAINTQAGSNDLVQSGGTLTVLGVGYNASKTSGTITQGEPLIANAVQNGDSRLSDDRTANALRTLTAHNVDNSADPTDQQVLYFDNASGKYKFRTIAGGGDFSSNTSTSVDGELLLFSGTAGKTGKRATGTGIVNVTNGVYAANGKSNNLGDFDSTAPTSSGKIPIWDNSQSKYIPGDPLVQGVVAEGSTTAANPINVGGYNTAGTPALHGANVQNATPGSSDYGFVTRNIPSGTQAVSGTFWQATQPVSIADGSETTLGAKADAKSTATDTTAVSVMSVLKEISAMEQAPASRAVTNAGTFAVQAAQSGNWTMRLQGNAGAIIDFAGQNASAPANAILIGGEFNTTPTTITSGNASPLQLDSAGNLLTKLNTAIPTGANTIGAVTQASGPWTENQTQIGGTTIDVNSGTKSAGTQRVVIATDQPQLTNKLLVTPDSVALPAHQSTNVDQVNGTTIDTNSGTKSAGTQRVVLATDQPALTNKLLVTPDSVALPANQSVNVNQVAGTATDTNSGNKSAGTQRIVLATDQPTMTNAQPVTPQATESYLGFVGGKATIVSANFTRPADTTAYASGDLIANSTTAGSVTPMSFTVSRINDASGMIRRAKLKKSTTSTTNASFRLHLYQNDPSATSGITNGDNGAWSTKEANYLGSLTCDMTAATGRAFSDAASAQCSVDNGTEINFIPKSGTQLIYGLIEARAAYTPGNAEVFTTYLEVLQN